MNIFGFLGGGSLNLLCRSDSKYDIQVTSHAVVERALYSASAEDLATVGCFLVCQPRKYFNRPKSVILK